MKYLIALLTAATGILHLLVGFNLPDGFGDPETTTLWMLVLNGVGYLVLLVLYWTSIGGRRTIRWILLAYTLITLIGYFIIGEGFEGGTIPLVIKAIELLLVIALLFDRGSDPVPAATTPTYTRTSSAYDSPRSGAAETGTTTVGTMASTAAAGVTSAAAGAASAAVAAADEAADDVRDATRDAADYTGDAIIDVTDRAGYTGEAVDDSINAVGGMTGDAVDYVGDRVDDAYDATADAARDARADVYAAGDAVAGMTGDMAAEVTDAVEYSGDRVRDAFDAADDVPGELATGSADVFDAAGDRVRDAVDATADAAGDAYDAAADFAGDVADDVAGAVGYAGDRVGDAVDATADAVGDAYDAAADFAGDVADDVAGAVGYAGDRVGDAVDATADAVGDAYDAAADTVGDVVSSTTDDVTRAGAAVGALGVTDVSYDDPDAGGEPTVEAIGQQFDEFLTSFGPGSEFTKSVSYIEGIGADNVEKLQAAGIRTIRDLLVNCSTRRGRKRASDLTGIAQSLILTWVNHVDLYRIKGVAHEYADLLEQSGVDTVVELAQRNPANLYKRMMDVNAQKSLVRRTPHASEVQNWVEQAKTLPRMIFY